MMTVFDTRLAFINPSRVCDVASRSGTCDPWANGYWGSCFHTWTCGSMMCSWAARGTSAPCSSDRREILRIHRLQPVHHVCGAAVIAGARPLPCNVQVHNQPAFESNRLQH